MGKLGRKKRGHNRGYFYRGGRGWYANDGKDMVPLLFPDGSRVKDRETPEDQVEAAYERWKKARQTADKARTTAVKPGSVTVEDVCRVYLAEASGNGAKETFLGRADSLFDLCYGLPSRFRSKNGKPTPMTEERKEEAKAARIHPGYGRMSASDFIPLHIDEWLRAHKTWKGSRRTKIQAVKKAFSYAKKSGLIPENRISKYPVPRARSRATYITPEQEAVFIEAANETMAMAIKVCIRTGARYFSEYAHLTRNHVKDHGERMEWVFQPHESKNGKLRVLRITDPEVIRITRAQVEKWPEGPIFRSLNGQPWQANNFRRRFRELVKRIEKKMKKEGTRSEFDADLCMYSTRHTYAKRMLQGYWTGKPVPIEILAQLMGNSVQVCRDHYLKWTESMNEALWAMT
jgi:integrase